MKWYGVVYRKIGVTPLYLLQEVTDACSTQRDARRSIWRDAWARKSAVVRIPMGELLFTAWPSGRPPHQLRIIDWRNG